VIWHRGRRSQEGLPQGGTSGREEARRARKGGRRSSMTRIAAPNLALLPLRRRREALHPPSRGIGSGRDGIDRRGFRTFFRAMRCSSSTFLPGTMVHNLELYPGARRTSGCVSAGGSAQLLSKEGDLALVKLPSGEVAQVFRSSAWRRLARSATSTMKTKRMGKAGRTRWHGKKAHRSRRGYETLWITRTAAVKARSRGKSSADALGFPDVGQEDAAQQAHRQSTLSSAGSKDRKFYWETRRRIESRLVRVKANASKHAQQEQQRGAQTGW